MRCDVEAGGTICGSARWEWDADSADQVREHTCICGVDVHEYHECSCGAEWLNEPDVGPCPPMFACEECGT